MHKTRESIDEQQMQSKTMKSEEYRKIPCKWEDELGARFCFCSYQLGDDCESHNCPHYIPKEQPNAPEPE